MVEKYARIFVRGHYLSWRANSFPGAKLEENCELRNRYMYILSRTNIRTYFRPNWRLFCLLSFKSFSQHVRYWKLGNITRIFPSFSWRISTHVTHLDQSRMSRTIWWIIKADSVSPRTNTITSHDQFKPIRIEEHLVVNYEWW